MSRGVGDWREPAPLRCYSINTERRSDFAVAVDSSRYAGRCLAWWYITKWEGTLYCHMFEFHSASQGCLRPKVPGLIV